ncbi:MAG: hypothetical protein ACP5E5_15835, partial [Acidobacteriaceae bacterium]
MIAENDHVYGIAMRGCRGVVEAAGLHRFAVDDHELVVHDRIFSVDADVDTHVGAEGRRGVALSCQTLVEHHADIDPAA